MKILIVSLSILMSTLLIACSCTGAGQPPAQEPGVSEIPAQEEEPVALILAGTPYTLDEYSLTLSPEVKIKGEVNAPVFGLSFTLANNAADMRVFRFLKSGVSVQDDLGNIYPMDLSCAGDPEVVSSVVNININPSEEVELRAYSPGNYCFDAAAHLLPYFSGLIPLEATQLIVEINDWGPFNGIRFAIDL